MRALCVLYDETCGFCVGCARWLGVQRTLVGLECLPAGSEEAARRFPGLRRSAGPEELVVVDDEGGVYRDTHAWLMVLWALEDYRAWAQRLSRPSLMPLARNAFELLSNNRRRLSDWLHLEDEVVRRDLEQAGAPDVPKCAPEDGACRLPSMVRCAGCGRSMVQGRAACPHCLAEVVGALEPG
ncbi:thiol-disulfide oxidoreductase DCC family protein [Vitiosangium sp. GDMCC 1.1324]|uniref:thiol-disulfide oxidoreductase DCC family protein n=1 Tax=Vitiosangium sp. (strain GDMCC 1.1324) TaxID=2138576 RepID=UPI000D391A58|nr:DCC1-like thiol-disulfide oxidoreductase family protein [Vitiosangium sp. GDMCC 1.1324]PTL82775.1 thiol-disulfide oxidoreductase [Vitiosangium sp. GDMCC 1.1324]